MVTGSTEYGEGLHTRGFSEANSGKCDINSFCDASS